MPIPLIRIKNPDLQVLEAYFLYSFIIYKANRSAYNYFRLATFQLSVFPTVNRNTATISSE